MKVTAFPALEGDCLLVEWTYDGPRRLLIDGGRMNAWKTLRPYMEALPPEEQLLELLVVSHIDADHIEGVLKMLADDGRPVHFADAWFNGYRHLAENAEELGPEQGENLSDALLALAIPWNGRFDGKAVVTAEGQNVQRTVAGLELSLLSPTRAKLLKLAKPWGKWLKKEGIAPAALPDPGPLTREDGFVEYFGRHEAVPEHLDVEELASAAVDVDDEPPNGSSIAFIADDGAKRCLFGADAHTDVLLAALEALPKAARRFDLFKLSHHGSAGNISTALLDLVDCENFLISTNGSRHQHPDPEAIAKILVKPTAGKKTLFFNYRQDWTMIWDDVALKRKYKYRTVYAQAESDGFLEITL